MKPTIHLILLLVLTSCFTKEEGRKLKDEFSAIFDYKLSANEPGGSILVKKGSEIIFQKNYGLADLETGKKITEHTIFNTGSISKTFVANGILILEEKGLLSTEDSIYKYFNDFKNEEIAQKIKIKHLLSHSSGLPDIRKVEESAEFYLTAKDEENFAPLKQVESLNFEPGERFEYSNPAFNGLALIIEQVSHQKWQTFIEEKIFAPSGMQHSKITDGTYPQEGVAHAYINENGNYVENDYGEYPTFPASGNGGVWSSVLDLAKYENAIQNHTFLSKEAIDKSRTIFYPDNWQDTIPPNIGCSWFILDKNNPQNNSGVKIIYHTGSQGGFRAFYVTIPEKDLVYIALFNRPVEGLTEMRAKGLAILKKYNWLD